MTLFSEAMDRLRLTAVEVAGLFDLSPETVRHMRLDPQRSGYRTPPPNWREVFARVARERVPELHDLIAELEEG